MHSQYKGSDKEGRIRLGNHYANRQWQIMELETGAVVLIPMVPVTNEEAVLAFNKVFKKHKNTLDALK